MSLTIVFAKKPAEVRGGIGEWSWSMGSTWSRTRSNKQSRDEAEDVGGEC